MCAADDSLDKFETKTVYRKDPTDRIVVILDVRNITTKQNQYYCNTTIDYRKLLLDIIGGRKCTAAIAVDSLILNSEGKDSCRSFHDELRRSGFSLELIPPSNNYGKQEGVDVKIALLALRYALQKRCDTVELISGDGDFTVLADELHYQGVNLGITSFSDSLSYRLKDAADEVIVLDDVPLIKMSSKKERETAEVSE